jgi:hypothetical protein
MISVEAIPGMGGGGDKAEWWMQCIKLWNSWYKNFVNATMYSQHNYKKVEKHN